MCNGLWFRRSLLTVLLAVLGAAVRAQDTPPPMPAPPAPMPAAVMPAAVMSSGDDYGLLNNPLYDYINLKMALARGYSLGELASMVKIARLSGVPLPVVVQQVETGRTFAWLASDYNLRLGDVLDASDERARIEEAFRLYDSIALLGQASAMSASSASYSVSGPSLAELEARFNQLNAQFPALPPTTIDAAPVVTMNEPPVAPPVVAPPPPPAPPAAEPVPAATSAPAPFRIVRHRRHRVHRAYRPRRHRRLPSYMTHRGS